MQLAVTVVERPLVTLSMPNAIGTLLLVELGRRALYPAYFRALLHLAWERDAYLRHPKLRPLHVVSLKQMIGTAP